MPFGNTYGFLLSNWFLPPNAKGGAYSRKSQKKRRQAQRRKTNGRKRK